MSRRTPKHRRPGSMANSGIRHVGLMVRDLEKSVEFYQEVLGLDSSDRKKGVARIRSGRDTLVLHEMRRGRSGFHFGFRVDSPSKVDEWQAWLRARNVIIYDDVREGKYSSIRIGDQYVRLIGIVCGAKSEYTWHD